MTDTADLDALLDAMTLAEQVSLLAGTDYWHTAAIDRLGIPAMRVSDGPAGARGTSFRGPASINVPCGTALAASFDPDLVRQVGELLGREARAKGARVLLAPTVNLHRTPVGGRNFECMSEDPHLTARTTVAYVQGVQGEGVACCIKHYVGNDTEFQRMSIDSRIDDQTLRELYLAPFEAAVREAGVMSVMTAYNRINGPFAADSVEMIDGVLRGEWGFDGCVMSDWNGLHSMHEALVAGLDLEMPGPTRHRGQALVEAVEEGRIDAALVRRAARNVLGLVVRTGALADGGPGPETTREDAADVALVRRAGAAGMVLLRNSGALPIAGGLRKVAVIGPNAEVGRPMGGGSAVVTPTHLVQPLEAIAARFEAVGVEVVHHLGCRIDKRVPAFDADACTPLRVRYYAEPSDLDDPGATPVREGTVPTSFMTWFVDPIDRTRAAAHFGARMTTTFTPPVSGEWTFAVASAGDGRLSVNGEVLIDTAGLPRGDSFFGVGTDEITATVTLEAGIPYEIVGELRRTHAADAVSGLLLGAGAPVTSDTVADAVALATDCDLAIVVVGTTEEWESEGWDRADIALPGRQDELIARVAAACPRTVVVVNAGSPVSMPWIEQVDAALMAWFPGQEFGHSFTDVLFGDVEPQGRLPVTFPVHLAETPAADHHPGRDGQAVYGEGRLVGYRWYEATGIEPLFPFGHGLGYATCEIRGARLTDPHTVTVEVANTSGRDGVEVVQVYAADQGPDRAPLRLVGYRAVPVAAGGQASVDLALDPRAYLTWSTEAHDWVPLAGPFELRVGRSAGDTAVTVPVSR